MNKIALVLVFFLAFVGTTFAQNNVFCNEAISHFITVPETGSSVYGGTLQDNGSRWFAILPNVEAEMTIELTTSIPQFQTIILTSSCGIEDYESNVIYSEGSQSETNPINSEITKIISEKISVDDMKTYYLIWIPSKPSDFEIKITNKTPTNNPPATLCSAGYKCKKDRKMIDGDYLQWQNSNCTWDNGNDWIYCQEGCEEGNNECNLDEFGCNTITKECPPTIEQHCAEKWVCEGNSKAYQNSNCGLTMVTGCQYGCSNGECKSAPIPTTPAIIGTNLYCSGKDVWQKTTYSNGTSKSEKYRECTSSCKKGACVEPVLVKPAIKTLYKSETVDAGFFASYEWGVTGTYSETGIEYSYAMSNWQKKTAAKNSVGKYAVILAPAKGHFWLYVRAYVVYQGKTLYGITEKIGLKQPIVIKPVISATPQFSFTIDKINLAALGIDGIKFFTIGSCIDDGILTFWCGFDVITTVIMVGSIICPADGVVLDSASIETKLAKISKTADLLKGVKTGAQFADVVEQVTFTYMKGEKYIVKGLKLTGAIDKGILKLSGAELKTTTPYLLKYILEKGDYSIMRLLAGDATKEGLEQAVKLGADLSKTRFVVKNSKTLVILEEGTGAWGLTHILAGHTNDFTKALLIKNSEIPNVIKQTVSSYDKVVKTADSYEFYKYFTAGGVRQTVKVVVSTTQEKMGRIITAFPLS